MVATTLVVLLVLLQVGNIRTSNDLKKLENENARLEDLVKAARVHAEKLRSPRHLAEQSSAMNLGLISVSQLEIVEAPARRSPLATDLARESGR